MKVFPLLLLVSLGFNYDLSHAASSPSPSSPQKGNALITEERLVAALSEDFRLTPTNFAVGRLTVQLPTSLNQAPETINGMAITALSLAGMAVDPDMMQEAWVTFDPQHQQWKAQWQKPPMFHFGMILLPALVHKVTAGQAISFESKGETAFLTKDEKGQLLVKRGKVTAPLTATDLRDLLRAKIKADGMCLFLDPSGNLVLEATGSRALALSNLKAQK